MAEPWLVLVNLMAGRRPIDVERIRRTLTVTGIDYDLEVPGSGEEMAAAVSSAAASGRWRLAVVGGDGTVNLAVNQILRTEWPRRPLLGVLPSGTGCDLLRTFGIPQNLEEAARHLLGDSVYPIDVGRLEGEWGVHYFVNVAQAGVGAAASQTATRLSRWWGPARYPMAFLWRLPGFPSARVAIKINDLGKMATRAHDGEALAAIFANGQFFAGGWNVAPRSSLTDGRLDLQVINCKKTYAVRLVPKIIKGVHLTDGAVRRYATEAFELITSTSWPIEADGDPVGNTPVSVSVVPGALDLKI